MPRKRLYIPHPKKQKIYIKISPNKRTRVLTHERFTTLARIQFSLEADEFKELLEIYMRAMNGNYSQASRLLGVSRSTLIRWRDDDHIPPQGQWYWPIVMAEVTKTILGEWRKLSSTKMQDLRQDIVRDLNKTLRLYQGQTNDYDPGTDNPKTYLLSLFRRYDEISTAHIEREGKFSKRTISNAAKELGLQRRTEGFGPDKETLYSLPEDPLA